MDTALVDLRKDLRRLGIQRHTDQHDPEDHLGALCEAMAMLLLDEVTATASASPSFHHDASSHLTSSHVTSSHAPQHHAAHFFQRHIAPWAPRCLHDLSQVDSAFYAALGNLGQAFLALENERYNELAEQHAWMGQPLRIITPAVDANDSTNPGHAPDNPTTT